MDLFVLSSFPQPPLSHLDGDDQRSSPSKLGKRLIVGITTCVLALVGAPIGAVIGALIGIPTETGFLRGAGTGAIAGAVFSVEVVESSVALWRSHEHGIYSNILYVVDILCSLLSGRLVREKVGRALQRAVQSQLSSLDLHYVDTMDIFETGSSTRGMSKESVDLLVKRKITLESIFNCFGERINCSVCLQDVQVGEMVRSLPYCQHMFHLRCIDSWLMRNGSCPLCRREI